MQKKQLFSYMHHPGKLDRESLEMIRCIKDQYPFFTTVRLLLIRNLHALGDAAYRSEIETAAAHVTDRRILYELIHPLSEEPEKPESPAEEDPETLVEENPENSEISEIPVSPVNSDNPLNSDNPENTVEIKAEVPAEEIQAIPVAPPVESPHEKKSDLRQNISDLLSWQLHELELVDPHETELAPEIAVDIQKTYGNENITSIEAISSDPDDLLTLDLEQDSQEETPGSPEVPEIPEVPNVPEVPRVPGVPDAPGAPKVPEIPGIPDVPEIPEIPDEPKHPDPDVGEVHSFSDWLSTVDKRESTRVESSVKDEPAAPDEKVLIDKFIELNPRLEPRKDSKPHKDISEDSVKEHDGIFTDTLARIYIKQGYYSKAIFAYEKLILKYPEKSNYFAGQINEIKKLTNKQ